LKKAAFPQRFGSASPNCLRRKLGFGPSCAERAAWRRFQNYRQGNQIEGIGSEKCFGGFSDPPI